MTNQNPQDQLLGFAMKELNKILEDLKEGKQPEMSSSMQMIASELEMANEKKKSMTEAEIKAWAERIANAVSKIEE